MSPRETKEKENKMKKWIFMLAVLVLGWTLFSCAKSGDIKKAELKATIVERIPDISEPDWVKKTNDFWEEKGFYVYRGLSEGIGNLQASRRAAEASAKAALAEQVKVVVRSEFSSALEASGGDANAGQYLKDIFFSAVENLTLSGVIVKESYSQKLFEGDGYGGGKTYYRSYVLAQVSIDDYRKMVAAAFNKTNSQVGAANKSAKELSKETEERFWKQQEKDVQE